MSIKETVKPVAKKASIVTKPAVAAKVSRFSRFGKFREVTRTYATAIGAEMARLKAQYLALETERAAIQERLSQEDI